jgi:hypothetical protein
MKTGNFCRVGDIILISDFYFDTGFVFEYCLFAFRMLCVFWLKARHVVSSNNNSGK